jgi:hypothetical protein
MGEPTADARVAGELLAAALPRLVLAVDDLVAAGLRAQEGEQQRDAVLSAADECRSPLWDLAGRVPDDAYLTLDAIHRAITETFGIDGLVYLAGRWSEDTKVPAQALLKDRLQRHVAHLHELEVALRTEDSERLEAIS